MQIVTEFPFEVVEEADLRIPLSDGVELSARVWFPQGCGPVPVVLEYLPYLTKECADPALQPPQTETQSQSAYQHSSNLRIRVLRMPIH